MHTLDRIDCRILYELDQDSRQSFSSIARKTKFTQETIRYRYNSLVSSGVISRCHAVVDLGRLGHIVYKVYLKLNAQCLADTQELIRYLVKIPEVVWVMEIQGDYDVGFAFRARHIGELSGFFDRFRRRFGPQIARQTFSVNISSEYYPRDYLVSTRRVNAKHFLYRALGEPIQIDPIDSKILECLGSNCRLSATDIQSRLRKTGLPRNGITREAVLKRIKRLERRRIVTGYRLLLDNAVMGQILVRVLLSFGPVSEETITAFLNYLRRNPHVTYIVKTLGENDCEIGLEVKSLNFAKETLKNLSRMHPKAVLSSTFLVFPQLHKFHFVSNL